jgi:hypothetical protein
MKREIRCRYCGLEIICDDVALTMAHQVPECAEFSAAVIEHDGGPGIFVDREGQLLDAANTLHERADALFNDLTPKEQAILRARFARLRGPS